jgi:lipopolysaccharide/colanic/teichoic acid biosynthesis glycosyltransferase
MLLTFGIRQPSSLRLHCSNCRRGQILENALRVKVVRKMRLPSPSSFGYLRYRLSAFDLFWAALAPLLALDLREAYVLSPKHATTAVLYCGASFVFSVLALLAFRVNDGLSRFFSVHDALNVVKAAVAAQLMTAVVLFSLTRLEGIPRTAPLVHLVILATGLFAARVVVLLRSADRKVARTPSHLAIEYAIIVGSTPLTSLYIKFVRAYSAGRRRIVAVLDSDPKLIGRAISGVPVVAPPQDLAAVIDDFAVHGIRTDRIIIGGDRNFLPETALKAIRGVCEQRNLDLDFVTQLVGLHDFPSLQPQSVPVPVQSPRLAVTLPAYFQLKRLIDFVGALTAIIVLSPLFVLTALLVLIDVGSPVLFWQQRTGQGAGSFFLYKFRSLRTPLDFRGNRVAEHQRLSLVGTLLRKCRLDELPQLFNVLVGDMSLIGPRPLLPVDQPSNAGLRLSVRPGITGWAQINGGNLINAEEKGALDEWYIRNASLWLDLRIVGLTIRFAFSGEKRCEGALAEAQAAQKRHFWGNPLYQKRRYRDAIAGRSTGPALRVSSNSEQTARPPGWTMPHQ